MFVGISLLGFKFCNFEITSSTELHGSGDIDLDANRKLFDCVRFYCFIW